MSTARKTAKRVSKSKITKPMTKPSTAVMAPERVYGSHKEGSRKGKVHELFKKEGPEAAWVLGLKLKLKEGTLRSWFAAWKRPQSERKEKVKTDSAVMVITTPEIIAV
jgi:hypothetical protein